MNFQVPQFIEIEDRIFGPLTFKQFIYIAGSAGLAFIIYTFLPSIYIAIVPMVAVVGFGLALAFYKINERPFILVVEAWFKYLFTSKLYLWKKSERTKKEDMVIPTTQTEADIPKLSGSRLKDLSWSLDVKEKVQ